MLLLRYTASLHLLQIKTPQDFIDIQLSNNYFLENDLDFIETKFIQIQQFNGILHGNGHCLKNILLVRDSNEQNTYHNHGANSLFQQLDDASFIDIRFENITILLQNDNSKKFQYQSLIATFGSGHFEKLHISNVQFIARNLQGHQLTQSLLVVTDKANQPNKITANNIIIQNVIFFEENVLNCVISSSLMFGKIYSDTKVSNANIQNISFRGQSTIAYQVGIIALHILNSINITNISISISYISQEHVLDAFSFLVVKAQNTMHVENALLIGPTGFISSYQQIALHIFCIQCQNAALSVQFAVIKMGAELTELLKIANQTLFAQDCANSSFNQLFIIGDASANSSYGVFQSDEQLFNQHSNILEQSFILEECGISGATNSCKTLKLVSKLNKCFNSMQQCAQQKGKCQINAFNELLCECDNGLKYESGIQECYSNQCDIYQHIECRLGECAFNAVSQTFKCANETGNCPHCNGSCQISDEGVIECSKCFEGYIGSFCDTSVRDPDYEKYADYNGDCYQHRQNRSIYCEKCYDQTIGALCNECQEGYDYIDNKCISAKKSRHKEITLYLVMFAIIFVVVFAFNLLIKLLCCCSCHGSTINNVQHDQPTQQSFKHNTAPQQLQIKQNENLQQQITEGTDPSLKIDKTIIEEQRIANRRSSNAPQVQLSVIREPPKNIISQEKPKSDDLPFPLATLTSETSLEKPIDKELPSIFSVPVIQPIMAESKNKPKTNRRQYQLPQQVSPSNNKQLSLPPPPQ